MLKKLKVTSHAFIFCLFGFTLMTVFLFSPNVYAQSSGTNMQNEAQDNLIINNQRIATWADLKRIDRTLHNINMKLRDLKEQAKSDNKLLNELRKHVNGMTKEDINTYRDDGEDNGLNLEPDQGNGMIKVPECSFEGTC